jgi:hypothetical protein
MPLHRIITVMEDETRTDEIVWNESTNVSYKPVEGLVSRLVQCFRYEHRHDMVPTLVTLKNKLMIMPTWVEVHPKTTLEDINWIKPQKRPRADIAVKTGDGKYKTTFNTATGKFKCSCMGFWRSNGNCKHVKELRESLQS